MSKYAIVNELGIVENVVIADDIDAFNVAGLYIVETDTAGPGWVYRDEEFLPPPKPELTIGELQAVGEGEKQRRLQAISAILAPLADALEFDIATAEERQRYDAWRRYRILLTRIDTSIIPVCWPTPPVI